VKNLRFRHKLGPAFVAIGALAACSGGGSQSLLGSPTSLAQNAVDGRSWMSPDAKKSDLLYVADALGDDVYVYSCPQRKLEGTLTGFQAPNGACVDKVGNVFIANLNAHDILEYPHGGARLVATLSDPGNYPIDCSVDPTSGNLSVTNAGFFGSEEGGVAIYKNATGPPTFYTDPDIYDYRYCGFDNHGNLFVDGEVEGPVFRFAELRKGSHTFTNISLNQSIQYPGGVLWDGAHVAVANAGDGARDIPTIYEFAISGNRGTEVGYTPLVGSDSVFQFWIQGDTVIAPDSGGSQEVRFYNYPAGGSARKLLTGFIEPAGAAVSKATKP
jgi:hypothetical protein